MGINKVLLVVTTIAVALVTAGADTRNRAEDEAERALQALEKALAGAQAAERALAAQGGGGEAASRAQLAALVGWLQTQVRATQEAERRAAVAVGSAESPGVAARLAAARDVLRREDELEHAQRARWHAMHPVARTAEEREVERDFDALERGDAAAAAAIDRVLPAQGSP